MSSRAASVLVRFLSGFVALCLLSADLAGAAALIDFQPSVPIPVDVPLHDRLDQRILFLALGTRPC